MKKKTLYIFLVICCFSLFSSAEQMMKGQDINTCCSMNKNNDAGKPAETKKTVRTEFELSPFRFFLSDI
jgi:hypothetical protein